jgi:hypothetical protein
MFIEARELTEVCWVSSVTPRSLPVENPAFAVIEVAGKDTLRHQALRLFTPEIAFS